MKRSYIIYGIIIILLIAGALFARERKVKEPVFVTPTETPTVEVPLTPVEPVLPPAATSTAAEPPYQKPVGWKTYENKEFGFAFDYPGGWEVEEFKTIKKEVASYSFYEIRLWAPGQFDVKKKIYNKYLNDHFADPQILIYADNKNRRERIEEQIKQNIKIYQKYGETVKIINLMFGIEAYLITKSTREEVLIIPTNKIMITFNSGLGISLDMNIINTFRLVRNN